MSDTPGHGRVPFVGLTGGIGAGQVDCARRARGAGRRHAFRGRRRPRAACDARGPGSGRRPARIRSARRLGRRGPFGGRRARLRAPGRSRLARGDAVAAGGSPDRRVAGAGAGRPTAARAIVVEVPLLFEAGMESVFDTTIAVVADEELRADRAGCARPHSRRGARRASALTGGEGALAPITPRATTAPERS